MQLPQQQINEFLRVIKAVHERNKVLCQRKLQLYRLIMKDQLAPPPTVEELLSIVQQQKPFVREMIKGLKPLQELVALVDKRLAKLVREGEKILIKFSSTLEFQELMLEQPILNKEELQTLFRQEFDCYREYESICKEYSDLSQEILSVFVKQIEIIKKGGEPSPELVKLANRVAVALLVGKETVVEGFKSDKIIITSMALAMVGTLFLSRTYSLDSFAAFISFITTWITITASSHLLGVAGAGGLITLMEFIMPSSVKALQDSEKAKQIAAERERKIPRQQKERL